MQRLSLLLAVLVLAGCDHFSLKTDDGRSTYTSGEVVTIYAQYRGERADETALSPGWIEWSSRKLGSLGTGPELMTSQLPPGRHLIVAKVMGPTGEVIADDAIRIKVENQAPRPEIVSVTFNEGNVMFLTGAADDHEDGHVRPSKMVWYVDDKEVGRGERVTVYGVTPGRHAVRLEATDSNRMLTGVMDFVTAPGSVAAGPVVHASTPAGDAAPKTTVGSGAPTSGILGELEDAQK
ncbi:MAG: hypothetical protein R3F62_02895 [Planctomycetota bacterium]